LFNGYNDEQNRDRCWKETPDPNKKYSDTFLVPLN